MLGELKDGAAGLVALSELLASRRIGPKAIAGALPSAGDACAGIASAVSAVASDVLSACGDDASARREVRAMFDRAEASVRALEVELAAAVDTPGEAKTRLVIERAANAASSNVASSLFVAELFTFASSPRVVSIHVADVLGFGPSIADGPQVIRATLDAPPGPVATTDARLLRALVELAVQIVVAAGVASPHVHVTGLDQDGGRSVGTASPSGGHSVGAASPSGGHSVASHSGGRACIRVGPAPTPLPPSSKSYGQRRSNRPPPPVVTLSMRRLALLESAPAIARAAAVIAGADVTIDPGARGVTIVF